MQNAIHASNGLSPGIRLLLPPGSLDKHPELLGILAQHSPTAEHRNLSRNAVYACDMVVFAPDMDWQRLNTEIYYAAAKTAFMLHVNASPPDAGGHHFHLSLNGHWVARGRDFNGLAFPTVEDWREYEERLAT